MTTTHRIEHRPEQSRFETTVEGHLCVAEYDLRDGVMHMVHTEVPFAVGGRGIAAELVAAALAHARTHGLRVRPVCSYVRALHAAPPRDAGAAGMTTVPAAAQAVLDFWFGAPGTPAHGQARAEWFVKNPAFDAEILHRFGPLIEQAEAGGLRDWMNTPPGALARIVLLDQFTRNVWRDTPRAFAGDALALEAAQHLVSTGGDRELPPLHRAFVYLPYEHAEDLHLQDDAVRLFTELAASAQGIEEMLRYAHLHRDVIARFGRFPHRNAILGRTSTDEELAFLQQPGSRF